MPSEIEFQQLKELTKLKLLNPEPGDWFHEFYSWFIRVTEIKASGEIVCDARGATKAESLSFLCAHEFSKEYCYSSKPGEPYVLYGGNDGGHEEEGPSGGAAIE